MRPPFSLQVELFEFKGEDLTEDEDGGIIRRIRKKGEGYSKPNEGALVESKSVLGGEWRNSRESCPCEWVATS